MGSDGRLQMAEAEVRGGEERFVPSQLAGLSPHPLNQENGAMESKPDRGGRTPLHYAALDNDVRKVDALLDGGADPNAADRQGFTALHFAAQQWSVQAAQILLDRGAAVDPVNGYGNTPLWTAVFNSNGRGTLIELLRSRGADPLRANKAGQTPLGLARSIGKLDVSTYFGDLP